MLTLLTPRERKARRDSSLTVPGFASSVISAFVAIRKVFRRRERIPSSCRGASSDGVPPPKKTVWKVREPDS